MKHFSPTGMGGGITSATPQDAPPAPDGRNSILIWAVGAFCIYGWEFLVCLPQEYKLIWRKKINVGFALHTLVTIETHRHYLAVEHFIRRFSIIVTLVAGVWAPSACNQCIVVGIAIAAPTTTTSEQSPNSENGPCGARSGPFVWDVVYWTVPLFYDALTVVFWRDEMTNQMLDIIWRDGFLYFLAIFSMNFVNVIIFLGASAEIRVVNLPATIMLEIILSCRLVLNLRDTHDQSMRTADQQKTSGTIVEPVKTPKWSPSTISTPIQSRTPDVFRNDQHSEYVSARYSEPANRV
ncbi:hypothetical protein JR316_0006525 [Psilocybe cubensis]|uniref:Uncharacterized protein n=1 Tax=Psilocybe cubensis TaxID=181762 RepID=A0ACB8H2Q0_PSICU|nr:hypothetical protein JR316_0006525 [Psilocybe cubensis]KAH9481995.1 hypothetical protein JR316_0006525 [Psilocybe cubensis]